MNTQRKISPLTSPSNVKAMAETKQTVRSSHPRPKILTFKTSRPRLQRQRSFGLPFRKRSHSFSSSFRSRSTNSNPPSYRCVRVLCRAKSKTRIKVTLSPDKQRKELNLDFKLRINKAKELQETSEDQIKSYQFYTDSGEPVIAELIVKESETEVDKIPLQDIKQKQEYKYKEISVTVSPDEIHLPELRTYDTEDFLCRNEQEFLKQRKIIVKKEIEKLLYENEEKLKEEEVPNIALMGSGGGYRAMTAMSGVINALYDTKLLDTIMYSAALSGSAWYLAVLYSHESWPNIDPREVQQQMKKNVTTKHHSMSQIFTNTAYSWFLKKMFWQEWNFTSDVFGPLLGESLIPDRKSCRWSEQASRLSEGTVPLPLLAAIHANPGDDRRNLYEWIEFSPYEVNFSKYGAAIKMEHFGSKFQMGFVESKKMELPLYQIMGICGSAYTITFSEMKDKQEYKSKEKETNQINSPHTSNKADLKSNGQPEETFVGCTKTSRNSCDGVDEIDGRIMNTSNSCDGVDEINGRNMSTRNPCVGVDAIDGRIMSTSNSCSGVDEIGGVDEIDGRIMSTCNSCGGVDEIDGRIMSTSNSCGGVEEIDGRIMSTSNSCDGVEEIDGRIMSTSNSCGRIDEIDGRIMSTYNSCGGVDEIDGRIMSTSNSCRSAGEIDGRIMSTSNLCRSAGEIDGRIMSTSNPCGGVDEIDGRIMSTSNPCDGVDEIDGRIMSTSNLCGGVDEIDGRIMSTSNSCRSADEIDGRIMSTSNPCGGVDEIDGRIMSTSNLCGGVDEIDGRIMSTSNSCGGVDEIDGRIMSTSNSVDELNQSGDNANKNNTSCDGVDELGDCFYDQDISDLFDKLCKIREEYEGISSPYDENRDEGFDELDGSNAIKESGSKWFLSEDRTGRAAVINNFLRKVSTTDAESLYDGNPVDNFLKFIKEQEKLMFIDAGIAQNSPYPLLFQPGRDIDLILSFDFTDRHKDSNPPFEMLKKAEKWAETNNIKFPRIDTTPFEGHPVEEVYVFGDDEDVNCPTILHFILVNKGFWEFEKPGVSRHQNERERLKDFTVYDKGLYDCMDFNYTPRMFDDLANLAEYIVLNNMEKIKECVKKIIGKKRKEKRKRHFTE